MTFCLGIKVKEGLIGIADTRITSGAERITARKVSIHQHGTHSLFLMTSGLRSVRDKAVTYFDEVLAETEKFTRLYQAVNAFAEQIRRVASEDRAALAEYGVNFNLHAIVGGQLEGDDEHRMYMIYPQGNWVELGQGTPFYIIGESGYGKPILERTLNFETGIPLALTVGFLAFNATITCAVDVDYPIDVVVYKKGTYRIAADRYTREELSEVSKKWKELIRASVDQLPSGWMDKVLSRTL